MNKRIGLYLMSSKGLAVLSNILSEFGHQMVAFVVTARDPSIEIDYYNEIWKMCVAHNVPVFRRSDNIPYNEEYLLSVSWRWQVKTAAGQKLIVLHDSLLPKYRGFAPLVNSLINGETTLGVSAIFASEEYDKGPILGQESINVTYPLKISDAIDNIIPCYQRLVTKVVSDIQKGKVSAIEQDETLASYSLWRDKKDYFVDWSRTSAEIRRFVDAVGYPYLGAATNLDGLTFRIRSCEEFEDVIVENRIPGKVIFVDGIFPIVVCGSGLLKITFMHLDGTMENNLPLKRFRYRFE